MFTWPDRKDQRGIWMSKMNVKSHGERISVHSAPNTMCGYDFATTNTLDFWSAVKFRPKMNNGKLIPNKNHHDMCIQMLNFLALKICHSKCLICVFPETTTAVKVNHLKTRVTEPGQTATYSTVQDCVATFCLKQGNIELKKSTRDVLNSTSCQNVYDMFFCFFLAMYSTELNVTNIWSNV